MKTFLLRLPDDLTARLDTLAKTEHRSRNSQIIHTLALALDAPPEAKPQEGK